MKPYPLTMEVTAVPESRMVAGFSPTTDPRPDGSGHGLARR